MITLPTIDPKKRNKKPLKKGYFSLEKNKPFFLKLEKMDVWSPSLFQKMEIFWRFI